MSIGLPNINIIFQQKAVSAISRSERGTACIIVRETGKEAGIKLYKYETDIESADYSESNLSAIKRAFSVPVNKMYVVTIPTDAEFSAVTALLETIKYNWVCSPDDGDQQELANYIINKNTKSKGKKYQALVYGVTADNKAIHVLKNSTVTLADTGDVISSVLFLPQLCAICAGLPMNRSLTYYKLENIADVDKSFLTLEKDADYWINEGNLVLINDDGDVRIARGVNSLTTFTTTDTEDMRKIIIVEAMNLILEDIYSTFKESYIGKYKNSYDNQCLFISAVNAFFRDLAKEEILDPAYNNHATVDVEAQRNAWLSVGKLEAKDWKEAKVKDMTFKSKVFLTGSIKILDAIEDMSFVITME